MSCLCGGVVSRFYSRVCKINRGLLHQPPPTNTSEGPNRLRKLQTPTAYTKQGPTQSEPCWPPAGTQYGAPPPARPARPEPGDWDAPRPQVDQSVMGLVTCTQWATSARKLSSITPASRGAREV